MPASAGHVLHGGGRVARPGRRRRPRPPGSGPGARRGAAGGGRCSRSQPPSSSLPGVYASVYTSGRVPSRATRRGPRRGDATMTTAPGRPSPSRAAGRPRLRRAPGGGRRALPRRLRRRRHLRVAPHRQPLAGHRGLGGAAAGHSSTPRCSTCRSRPGPRASPTWPRPSCCCATASPEPTVSELTRIGTVEGFGAMLRMLAGARRAARLRRGHPGTAIDHLDRGLFEAHARDEAGFEDEAGHDRMWFVARDIAFENPVTDDETAAHAGPHGHRSRPPRRPSSSPSWPQAAWPPGRCPTTSTSPWR